MQVQIPCNDHDRLLGKAFKSQDSIFAQNAVKERLIEAYSGRIKVDFTETRILNFVCRHFTLTQSLARIHSILPI